MEGEVVQISGAVCANKGTPSEAKIILQSSKLITEDWFSQLYQISGKTLGLLDNSKPEPEIVYKTSIFSINGSYTNNLLNTQKAGSYNITATLANSNETSFTKIEIENPLNTLTAKISLLGVISFLLLLFLPGILLEWGGIQENGIHLIEKVNFILISTWIFLIIFALSFADVGLGTNSPVGLVLKHPLDEKGQIENGGEWIINIGGHPSNNFANGIEIPVYVIVFGIVGGFIRYFYETTTSRKEETTKELKEIEEMNQKNLDDFKYIEFKESTIIWWINWWKNFLMRLRRKSIHPSNQNGEGKPDRGRET